MVNKPREITGIIKPYNDFSEIVIGYKPGMTPKIAMQWWMGSASHRAAILTPYWRSMGVALLGGHAVVWFRQGVDPAGGEAWIYSV